MTKVLCGTVGVLSAVSLTYAAWLHATLESRISATAAGVVRAREEEIVKGLSPHLQRLCTDFGAQYKRNPRTIEELVEPLIHISDHLTPVRVQGGIVPEAP